MDHGELLTRWTARLAMLLYVLSLALRGSARGRCGWLNASRLTWTAGCGVYLLHVICAFQFVHHWSHTAAYEETARRTADVTGLEWGGGLYVNYVFTVLWTFDMSWWWFNPKGYETRPTAVEWTVQGCLGFIAFNATVVFAEGMTRWFGVVGCVILLFVWVRQPQRWQKRLKALDLS